MVSLTEGRPTGGTAPEILIRPPRGLIGLDLPELFRSRHLVSALVRRNVRVELGQFNLGVFWICLHPLIYTAVFVLFKRVTAAQSHVAAPYVPYLYSGLILWFYMLTSIVATVGSIRSDAAILSRTYVPPLIPPLSRALSSLVVHSVTLLPLVALMAWHSAIPGLRILLLPGILLPCLLLILGVGLALAPFSIEKRDTERALTTILYLALFISPVLYAPDMIPERARTLYSLNPMAGILMAFRSALFREIEFPLNGWLYSMGCSSAVFLAGLYIYGRTSGRMRDRL